MERIGGLSLCEVPILDRQDPLLCIYLHTLTITHTLPIACTCCCDEIKGTQGQDFTFSDSLSE